MEPERWQQIQDLYHTALEREPNERSIFLDKACAEDEALRAEVESLLTHHQQAGSFIETPALEEVQGLLKDQPQNMLGRQIGAYKVLSLLGIGGMGEVYLAQDSRLERKVALKVLPPQFTQDEDRVHRSKREARAASTLNHPNILTIHEIGETDGTTFIATEFIEGETLRRRLAQRRMKLSELLDVAIQVASALTAAHQAGIVHRDVKPENVMVRPDGLVKVLDFGLAKLAEPRLPPIDTEPVTESTLKTESGMIMGTVHYMSPEQVLGQEVDLRTDIFSLGVVLYEMATGMQPFQGDSPAAIFDAILHRVPPSPRQLNPDLSVELEHILIKALEKDREVRYQSVSDLRADLKRLRRDMDSGRATGVTMSSPPFPGKQPRLRWRRRAVALAGTVALLAGVLAVSYWRAPLPPPKLLRYVQLTSDGQQKLFPDLYNLMPLVTDGGRVYFKPVGFTGNLAQVSATGGETVPVPTPFEIRRLLDISPNRSEVLVLRFSRVETEYPLWVLPLLGGSPRRLGDVLGHDGTWSPDGQKILYSHGSDLYLAKSDGTESRKFITAAGRPYWPRWSPDGSRLRFTVLDQQTHAFSLWEVTGDGTSLHPLLPGWNTVPAECCGSWTADGKYFLFQSRRDGTTNIWALREQGGLFRKPSPEPVRLTTGPMSTYFPVASPDSRKLFVMGAQRGGELMRYDGKFGQFVPYLSGVSAEHLDFSRDGGWVAYVTYPEATLWRSKIDGSQRLQLSFPPLRAILPHWSPDGKQVGFTGILPGKHFKIHLVSAEGGTHQQLLPGERGEVDFDWSPDGNSLVFGRDPYREDGAFGPVFIHHLDLGSRQVAALPGSEGLWYPVWSPEGRYLAAVGPGQKKLLLFDFTTQKWAELAKLANPILNYMSWSQDGKYLYFDSLSQDNPAIFRVRISDRKLATVVSLKDFRREWGSWSPWFGLAPDGSPLLLRRAGSEEIYALDWEAP